MLAGQRRGVIVVAHIIADDPWVGLSRQRTDHVREGIVRQPGEAVVIGPARIHPVTRAVAASYASRCSPAITLVVPDGKEGATGAHRKTRLPLRLGRVCITVELEGGTKGHPAISGTDVEDIPRVAVATVAGRVNVVNNAVISGWLTPAHVPPV